MQQKRHKWLCDVMNVMHSNRCIVSIWNACKVPPSAAIRQDNLGKFGRKIYFIVWTIYKLWKTNEHTILKYWALIKNIVERTHTFPYNILFTFLMDRGRAPNGIGHLMILSLVQEMACRLCPLLLTWFKRRLANRFSKRVYLPRLNQNAFYQKIIEIKSAMKGIWVKPTWKRG